MKRTILAAIAFSTIAIPMAEAQSRHEAPRWQPQHQQHQGSKHHDQFKKQRWSRGERLPEWQHRRYVNDYRKYDLKRPGRHQQWVRVGNDYLLVNVRSGIITAVR